MKYLPLIWAGLWRKRARTVLTLLSIVSAFVLFGILQGVATWLSTFGAGSGANRLYVVSRISQIQPLPGGYLSRISRIPGVRDVAPVAALVGSYQKPSNVVVILATAPRALFALYPEWKVPQNQLQALTQTRTGVIVGARLARLYGWRVGDVLPIRSSVLKNDGSSDWAFEVVGVYDSPEEPSEDDRIIANYEYIDEARHFERGTAQAFVIGIDDRSLSARICAAIDAQFANSSDETLTQDEKEYIQGQIRQLGDISSLVNAIAGAVFFTLLFLTGNTMTQSVRERIPELAVLKAIGFSDRSVALLILAEATLLCAVAAVLGLLAAAALFPATAAWGIAGTSLPPQVIAMGLLIAAALALISALPPAWRARRLQIVDALAGR